VFVTEKMETSFLLEESATSDKIYCIDQHLYCVVSGLSADANYLIEEARIEAQKYKLKYRAPIPIEQLIILICDMKQQYTQFGGQRPFGAAFLFAGYDRVHGYQLYSTDPSGTYVGWKATAIGTKNLAAKSFLKQEYREAMTLEQGLDLGLKSIVKTIDTTQPNPKKIEVMMIAGGKDRIQGRILPEPEVRAALKRNGFEVPAQA
jgi:20S proteasome subunit alpha 3